MKHLLSRAAWVLAAVLLGSCGGGRESSEQPVQGLEMPQAVRVDAALCRVPTSAMVDGTRSLIAYLEVDGDCVRSFTGLTPAAAGSPAHAPRERRLALTPSRPITIDELFDWAELQFAVLFPSAQSDRVLGPYTYRYYPETQNHAAVADNVIYVQGPVTGGLLMRVGTLAEVTCIVKPGLCTEVLRDCNLVASWSAGGNQCTANPGQPSRLVSGSTLTLTDSLGNTTGSASFRCTDGQLDFVGTPNCTLVPPKSCDTSALSWTVGSNSCTPNPSDPKTLASGASFPFTDSAGTSGTATYSCSDGTLTRQGTATCNPPAPADCVPTAAQTEWNTNGAFCSADNVPERIANSSSYTFLDTTQKVIGNITFACSNGVLTQTGPTTCYTDLPRIEDSFGGDGGAADGGANGDGSAADGAPIVGGRVSVTDSTGRVVFADSLTDSRGYYRLKLTGMSPPLVVSVTRADGAVRRSLSTQRLKTNGYIFIAVTGLTDWIASEIVRQVTDGDSPAALTPAMVAANPAVVTAAINALRFNEFVNPELVAAGIDPATFDPLATPFRPDGTGYDKVLDNVVVSTDPETGGTVIGPTYCFTPTSWTVGNFTCVPDPGTAATIGSYRTLVVSDTVGSPRGTVGFTCIEGKLQNLVLPNCKP